MPNANARALRKSMTRQEVRLWQQLRALKPRGYHFRRQAPIGPYIVDFACLGARLVIEADGGQHNMMVEAGKDARRDAFLRGEGFVVLRFWNSEIDSKLDGVLQTILAALPPRDLVSE